MTDMSSHDNPGTIHAVDRGQGVTDLTAAICSPVSVAAVTRQILQPAAWIERRVETVEFVDDVSIRRRSSVQFSQPLYVPSIRLPNATTDRVLIPITLLRKEPLVNLDVRDAQGRAVATLTSDQNRELAGRILCSYAAVLGDGWGELPDTVRTELEEIAGDAPAVAEHRANKLLRVTGNYPKLFRESTDFMTLLGRLTYNFVLAAILEISDSSPRLLKFAYDEPFEVPELDGPVANSLAFIGLRPLRSDTPAINDCASFHFEISVPDDTQAGCGVIEGIPYHRQRGDESCFEQLAADEGTKSRVHLHARDTPLVVAPRSRFNIMPEQRGWLRSALAATWAVTLVFAVLVAWPPRTDADTAQSVTLFLGIVAALATFLVRSGEHAMVSVLLMNLRWLVGAATTALPVAAAVILLSSVPARVQEFVWWAGAGLAGVVAVVVTLAYVLPSRLARRHLVWTAERPCTEGELNVES